MAKVNIKQITNFDQPGKTQLIGNNLYRYYSFNGNGAFKIGYCTNDNEGMNYPIYLNFTSDPDPEQSKIIFYIGKTGMFEFEPVTWKDVNDKEDPGIQPETNIPIYGFWVCDVVPFCMDYCYYIS